MPRIFTTLSAAVLTPPARAIEARGGATRASGPSMRGNGSRRESVASRPLDGGRASLSRLRIAERCTSRRASPPLASASAPSTQAMPIPTHAVSTAPRKPSTAVAAGERTRLRNRDPTPSSPSANTAPASSAPISANAGAHGERFPSASTSGPSLIPSHAPSAKPTSARAPATKP